MSRLTRLAPRFTVALLLVAVAGRLAMLVDSQGPHAGSVPATQTVAAAAPSAGDIATIQHSRLFGASVVDPAAAGIPASSELVLAGVFAGADPEIGLAMLGQSHNSIGVYSTGAEVVAGVRLHSVYVDHVLIDRAGQLVRLDMPERPASGAAPGQLQAGVTAPAMQEVAPRRAGTIPRPSPDVPLMPGQVLRTQIVRQDGKFQGYRLSPGTEQQVFQNMGLRTGDVVVAVNGRSPAEPSADLQQVLNSERSARVTIVRDGARRDLVVNLDSSRN